MRARHIVLLSAAACIALPVSAQPAPAEASAATAAPARKAWVDPAMARGMRGSYGLDDGRTLRVSEKGRRLYADLGDGAVEIVHIGDDRFEAIGRDLGLRFEGGPQPHAVFARIGPQRQVASARR